MDRIHFEEVAEVIEKMHANALEKGLLEIRIKQLESETLLRVTSEEKFFVNGKPPAIGLIDSTYKQTGIDGEIDLVSLRKELAKLDAEYIYLKNQYEFMKIQIEVWRTVSANERQAVI